jgi:hypothetical protein
MMSFLYFWSFSSVSSGMMIIVNHDCEKVGNFPTVLVFLHDSSGRDQNRVIVSGL